MTMPATQEELRTSEIRYRRLFEAARDGILILNAITLKITDVNPFMTELLGYSRDGFLGKELWEIGFFSDKEASKAAFRELQETSYLRYDDLPLQTSHGKIRQVEFVSNVYEEDGEPVIQCNIRDITERRRSEEAIKEQARILDLAPVLIRDLAGRILFWNTGAEQLYGWTSEEALGKLKHSLLRTEFPIALKEIKATLFAQGHWDGELVNTKKNGERIVVLSHWVLHKNDQDEPKAVLEVNNDITERRQAEKEILRLNQELEQRVADRTAQLQAANKELETFSYSVSHDLRAPLRHINGFSQALLEDCADQLDETGKGYLQEVRRASQEMGQLIDDMLQLARVTRSEMHREFVNLSELAHSIVTELQKADAGRGVAVDIEEGLYVSGDKRLLRIMLTNLIGNAWKFTSKLDQAEISFGQTKKGAELVYFVRDNGAGFDMTYVAKLFGAFQRLHGAGEFEGTGVGLATVQRIINRHGGHVWAEGAVNEGAIFYFTLTNFREAENGSQSDLTG